MDDVDGRNFTAQCSEVGKHGVYRNSPGNNSNPGLPVLAKNETGFYQRFKHFRSGGGRVLSPIEVHAVPSPRHILSAQRGREVVALKDRLGVALDDRQLAKQPSAISRGVQHIRRMADGIARRKNACSAWDCA